MRPLITASIFSEARWLNAKRVAMYARLIVALNVGAILVVLALSPNFIDPMGKPVGTDFVGFWAAGRMAIEGHALEVYEAGRHFEAEQRALPWKADQTPPQLLWLYPPTFLTIAAGLALLPYGVSLSLWMAATLLIYLAPIRFILPGWTVVMAALAFPAVFTNLAHGQTGFLTAGLFGSALLLIETSPWAAGVLFGLMAYKPQFGLLVPLALMAGGYWRTICAAGLTLAGTISLSWSLWGTEPWRDFFASMRAAGTFGLEHGSIGFEKLQSIFAGARMLGSGNELAWVMQGAFALLGAAVVVRVWLKPGNLALKSTVLCIASLMATPYVFDYDLIILALPLAWLTAEGLRAGFLPWEKVILMAAWILPLLSRLMAKNLHIPAAPAVMVALLAMSWRVYRSSTNSYVL
jgi:alpha-1,2-mannosyltransferase